MRSELSTLEGSAVKTAVRGDEEIFFAEVAGGRAGGDGWGENGYDEVGPQPQRSLRAARPENRLLHRFRRAVSCDLASQPWRFPRLCWACC